MKRLIPLNLLGVIFILLISSFGFAQNFKYYQAPDKIRIAYTDSGSGKVVVLLHGFINTGANWRKTALYKDLLKNGYRVIVPDLRGNGHSDKPHEDKFYTNDIETKDVIGILTNLKIKSYEVVGYSRGAIVAAKLITKDKRVVKVVLGGMGQHFTNPNWDRRLMFAAAFNGKFHLYPEAQGAVKYAKSINADTVALGLLQKYQPVTTPKELKKFSKPVLIIAGDEDKDNGNPEVLQTYFRDAKLSIVKGNHNITYNTEAFSAEIIGFLK
ncbi:alpha/beta hydrolase fold containing protein [Emticicia oligotrophica DSM 17448]|uniref:Alpha/beta hydrolase fold containing protein n=1 Tax=Emticicia oligotrophica (strain DSM 17448 / CIP 109782 / MTCC 6937 / GPTSA100-15) TaxID=929562 RepID=A0ABM5N3C5_EMTOG|nr:MULTISPECIES: alpha/beta hydrolase [Emticicia]AFK03859.1 alpha/beta hydrolase fold containing protein [Emticicia oligotrophica DSM 17448]